jgi:hypothetical protein
LGLGHFVDPDSVDDLVSALSKTWDAVDNADAWGRYLLYASWENHVYIAVNAFKKIEADAT